MITSPSLYVFEKRSNMGRSNCLSALESSVVVAALAMAWSEMTGAGDWLEGFRAMLGQDGDVAGLVLKGAGISIVSELGAQLCMDAGERALAGRITLASRLAMLTLCAPMLSRIAGLVSEGLACGG